MFNMIYKGKKEAYPGIGKIEYEGKKSKIRWHSDGTILKRKLVANR